MPQEPDKDLLNRFFNNECSDSETELVLQWLAQPENELKANALMAKHWDSLSANTHLEEVNFNDLKNKINQKIGEERNLNIQNTYREAAQEEPEYENKELAERTFSITPLLNHYSLRIAASFLILVLSGALLYFLVWQKPAPLLTFTNPSGKVAKVQLPDGTKIWLNARTTLKYPANFKNQKNREVYLDGEAYFDVIKDKNHPFIVKTSAIQIRVLGTAFNIKSYPDDDAIETTLLRGKVAIEKRNTTATGPITELAPNQQAIFTRDSKKMTTSTVKAEKFISWQQGSFVFEDETIENVIKVLNRWYGVRIQLKEERNKACRLTATIQKESLVQLLDILQITSDISYSIKGKTVFIQGAFCE